MCRSEVSVGQVRVQRSVVSVVQVRGQHGAGERSAWCVQVRGQRGAGESSEVSVVQV